MKLTRGQATVLVGLLAKMKEKIEQDDEGGVRVKELASRLHKSPSSVRTTLNQLANEGLVQSERPKPTLQTPTDIDPREKIWQPAYSVDESEINDLLKDYPEIEDHLQIEEIEQLLGVNIKFKSGEKGELCEKTTKAKSKTEMLQEQSRDEIGSTNGDALSAIASEDPQAVKPVLSELTSLLDRENPEIQKHAIRIIYSIWKSHPELISDKTINKLTDLIRSDQGEGSKGDIEFPTGGERDIRFLEREKELQSSKKTSDKHDQTNK